MATFTVPVSFKLGRQLGTSTNCRLFVGDWQPGYHVAREQASKQDVYPENIHWLGEIENFHFDVTHLHCARFQRGSQRPAAVTQRFPSRETWLVWQWLRGDQDRESQIICNLATPYIDVFIDIEVLDIDVNVNIEYSTFDIDVTGFNIVVAKKKTTSYT
jgi:hypothetical protein